VAASTPELLETATGIRFVPFRPDECFTRDTRALALPGERRPKSRRPGRIRVIYSGRTFRHKTHNGGIPALGGRSCRRSITSSQLASRICLGGAALLTLLSPKRRKKTRPSFAPAETDMLERDPRTFPVTPSRVQASSRRSSPRLARRSSY